MWNDSVLENEYRDIISYDGNYNKSTQISLLWMFVGWANSYKWIYSYNANNNMSGYIGQYWESPDWFNNAKTTFTYDTKNNRIAQLDQDWDYDKNSWVDKYNSDYVYDAKNNMISYIYKSKEGSSWINYSKETHTYNANNFRKSDAYIYWDETGINVKKGDSNYYYFSTVGINEFMAQESIINIYPNPSNGKFTINSSSPINSIEIYNLTGELIYSSNKLNQQNSNEIDLSKFQKGIYFIKVSDCKKVSTDKVIIH